MIRFLIICSSTILLPILAQCTALQVAWLANNYEITLADSTPNDTTQSGVTANRDPQGRRASLLSAFFGLDNALPALSDATICEGAGGKDGMPVIFSHEIDVRTMQAGDFRVITESGHVGEITCVTLAPADDRGELRTVLVVGNYGSATDQPAKVEVTGNLLSLNNAINFKGTTVTVTPLKAGPTIVFAEVVPASQWELEKKATSIPFGGGNGCPTGTKLIVRAIWAGGVTRPGGKEIDMTEGSLYRVTIQKDNDPPVEVSPFAVADLGDGDNNHLLCIDVHGSPKKVFFPAGHLTDPREDLNPDTEISVQN